MIDLIIPSYNDLQGLYDTLSSCYYGLRRWPDIKLTIIDDASTNITETDWTKFKTDFNLIDINLIFLSENKGPGYARQYAIDHTTEPYILFIDCGDLFINSIMLRDYLTYVKKNPDCSVLMTAYLYEVMPELFIEYNFHSEFHATLLKREFLMRYNLRIPTAYSYCLEDTPFMACAQFLGLITGGLYNEDDQYWSIRTHNINSLTQKDNQNYYFKNETNAYAANCIEILETIDNLTQDEYDELIYNFFAGAYTTYLHTLMNRPNWIPTPQEINAVTTLYTKYYQPIENKNPQLFYKYFYNSLSTLLATNEPPHMLPLSFNDFIQTITKQ